MKILWIPQISSKSADGKVLLNSDSNMIFLFNLMYSEFGKNNSVDLVIEFDDISNEELDAIGDKYGIKRIYKDWQHSFTNALQERLHCDISFYNSILENETYDIIFVNEPTKATVFKMIAPRGTKIVSYNHWLAVDNMKQLELRQLEGMQNSDLCLFNSGYAINRIGSVCNIRFMVIPRMEKLQPSFASKHMCSMKMQHKPYSRSEHYGIVYNHRLSGDEYYLSAYRNLIQIMNLVEAQLGIENMPRVYFTNPSGKSFNVKKDKPYFQEIHLETQEEYYNFLQSDAVQIHMNTFFESKGMWSMSTVEAGACGNACLLPNRFGYKEIFEEGYHGYCESPFQMANKLHSLLNGNMQIYECANSYLLNHNNLQIGQELNEILRKVVNK